MEEHYAFRFIRSSWGIHIDISAKVHLLAQFSGAFYEVEEGLYISFRNRLGIKNDEIAYLPIGLRLVHHELWPILEKMGPLVVQIIEIEYAPTDYQSEGLAYAIAGWMMQHFNLDYKLPDIYFSRENKHYVFNLPPKKSQDEILYRQMLSEQE